MINVGASYGGGTVFCVSNVSDTSQCVTNGEGYYGLVMANEDQVNYNSNSDHGIHWSSVFSVTNATSESDGAANTATIIAALPSDDTSNNAAWLCHDYTGGGYTDWYLPAKDELNNMYLYAVANNLTGSGCTGSKAAGIQCLIGGGTEQSAIYWSSSEGSVYDGHVGVWVQFFSHGIQVDYGSKPDSWLGVRAVRAFNYSTNQPVNHLSNINKTIFKNNQLKFTALDFTANFNNSCGYSLAKIKITNLPVNGTLKLAESLVVVGSEINITEIANLTYEPNSDYVGSDSFNWNGYADSIYSENDAEVNITVVESNTPIISELSPKSGMIGNNMSITITGSNFVDGTEKSTVKLENGKDLLEEEVAITGITSNNITCNLNLSNVSLTKIGPWDLVVTNPDGKSGIRENGFMIESGVEPVVSEITTEITDNILTITIGGSNFLVGITGVQVELINGTDVITAIIQTITDGQIVCIVDVGSNPGVLVGEWAVQVTNADEKKSNEKTIRPKGMISTSSANGVTNSWILPTAIAVPIGVVAVAAATASCFILHKRHACCFSNGNKDSGAALEVGMVAPVYDLS